MKPILLAALLACVGGSLMAQQPDLPPPFPRTNATRLFENDRINVWDIVWPAGQPTALHRHIYDQVGTYYSRGGRAITTPEGNTRTTITEVGSLSTTRKGTTHIEEGNTTPPLRAVFIELKQTTASGAPPADVGALVFPRADAKQVLDDERVRVWDLAAWTPGPQPVKFRAAHETVIVWLGDGMLRVTSRGASEAVAVTAGSMRHVQRGASDTLEMTGGSPRALFFEIK